MKKNRLLFAAIAALVILPSIEAQSKKRLAILPFTGGQAQDGETISVLLSNQQELLNVFTIQPRNSAIDRIMGEQQYQRQSGLINSNAISEIGKLNTADLVVSGHITRLGNKNLIIISIIDVTEIQQIAGVYYTYDSIVQMREALPNLAKTLADMSRKKYQDLPGLAVPSFDVPSNVNANDAMVLAQILATEIVSLGKYAVFPRNNSVQDVLREHQFQRSGQTSGAMALGTTKNIKYILSSAVMGLGSVNLFTSQILNIEGGDNINGTDKEYQSITQAIDPKKNLMKEIAGELLGTIAKTTVTAEIEYQVHMAKLGWGSWVGNNTVAGTTGQSRQIEAIKIRINSNIAGGIRYQAHVQSKGWLRWEENNQYSGTVGEGKRMEAIRIELTGDIAGRYNVSYQVHMSSVGWGSWASNGETAGSTGQGRQIEAIRIRLEPK